MFLRRPRPHAIDPNFLRGTRMSTLACKPGSRLKGRLPEVLHVEDTRTRSIGSNSRRNFSPLLCHWRWRRDPKGGAGKGRAFRRARTTRSGGLGAQGMWHPLNLRIRAARRRRSFRRGQGRRRRRSCNRAHGRLSRMCSWRSSWSGPNRLLEGHLRSSMRVRCAGVARVTCRSAGVP